MIVDSHVHLLPGRLGHKVRAFFADYEDRLAYPNDHRIVCESLAADGVQRVWALPYAHKVGVAVWLNEQTATIADAAWPLEVVNGCTTHPDEADPAGVVRDAVERLDAGVLKLHSSVGSFDADDPRLDQLWAYCAEQRLPTVVHVGHDVDGRTHGHELTPVRQVAARFPEVRLIIAHCAAPAVPAAFDLIETYPNVYGDLTPVLDNTLDIPFDRLAPVADRLLFGSDAPNTGFNVGDLLAAVRGWGLDEHATAAILGGTANRLLSEGPSPRPIS